MKRTQKYLKIQKRKRVKYSQKIQDYCVIRCSFKKGRIIEHDYLWRLKIDCHNLSYRITYNLFRYLPLHEVELNSCLFSPWSLNGLIDSTKVESREGKIVTLQWRNKHKQPQPTDQVYKISDVTWIQCDKKGISHMS